MKIRLKTAAQLSAEDWEDFVGQADDEVRQEFRELLGGTYETTVIPSTILQVRLRPQYSSPSPRWW